MLAAISHDLRTPIASLWLRAEMVEDAELRGAMVSTLADLRRMVDATLTFAREDATNQKSETFDLTALMRSVADDHRALGHDVTLSTPDSLPFHCRPAALRRAVGNLVENAIRYGKRARVSLGQDPQGIRIRVEDDGPGIPSDQIDAMFEPFARLEGSRSDETGGTGLGLAIARSTVRAHGGEIRLFNRTGRGLTAEICLPALPTGLDPVHGSTVSGGRG
jgi:signal transduction histidine kinase